MAWLAMLAALAYPLLLLGTDSQQLGEVAVPFYLFTGSVVGSYVGFATLDDRWQGMASRSTTYPDWSPPAREGEG